MDSTRIKIGQIFYGQKEGSEDIAIVKVESVGIGGINYNDTDNSFQYSFDELFGIPVDADVLLTSGFTLINDMYVNDNISFIKIKQINGQWFWYADKDKCILVKYLHELQGLYGELTGNVLAVDEDALSIELDSPVVLSAPTGFATSDMTPNTVTITWDEDADAEGYSYQIDDGAWVAAEVAEIELTGLTYSTTYTLRVKSIGDDDLFVDSPESEEFKFKTDPLIVLATPSNLAESAVTQTTATVSWDANENAKGFKYAVDGGEQSELITENHIDLTGLTANNEYSIVVQAIGDGIVYDDSLVSDPLVFSTLELEVLATPEPTVTAFDDESITIGWDAVDNAEGYTITWGEALTQDVLSDVLTYKIEGLNANAEYSITVKALGDGIVSDDSLAAEVLQTTDKIQLDAPSVTGSALGTTSVKFSWDEVANSVGYICQYKEGEGSFVDYVGEIADDEGVRSVTLTELTPGTSYTMLVKAIAAVESDYRDSDSGSGTVSTNAA